MKTFNEIHSKDIEDWLAQGANKSIDKVWGVKIIMEYFGRWIGNNMRARRLMDEVDGLIDYSANYSSRLLELRRLLMDKYGYKDIPFIIRYK